MFGWLRDRIVKREELGFLEDAREGKKGANMKAAIEFLVSHKKLAGFLLSAAALAVHEFWPEHKEFVDQVLVNAGVYLFGAGFHLSDAEAASKLAWEKSGGVERRNSG